jgi:hypothetical protein
LEESEGRTNVPAKDAVEITTDGLRNNRAPGPDDKNAKL